MVDAPIADSDVRSDYGCFFRTDDYQTLIRILCKFATCSSSSVVALINSNNNVGRTRGVAERSWHVRINTSSATELL